MDRPKDTYTGFLPSYAQLIMNKFKKKADETFDVYLCAEDQRFKAHKVVLAASSEYFRIMFSSNFKESREKEIKFDIDAENLKIIIDYVYSGKLELTDENIEGVFETAHLFQYDKICQHIAEKLSVSLENCITLLKISNVYSLCELNVKVQNYLNQNFSNIWNRTIIIDLNFNDFSLILQSNDIEIYYEEEIFTLVKNWINHDRINRSTHLKKLLRLVRLHVMPPEFISKEVRPFCKNYPETLNVIIDAYEAQLIPEIMKNLPPKRKFPHIFKDTVFIFFLENKILKIYKLSLTGTHSLSFYMTPNFKEWFCGVISIDDTIMIAGGSRYIWPPNKAYWFNLKTKSEVQTSTFPEGFSCRHVGVITNDDKSYSIFVIEDNYESNYVLIWNSKTQIWKPIAAMINKKYDFGTTMLNKKLYVVGGINENEEYLNSMEMYDPTTNTWSECSPMVTKRRNPGVGAIDNYLYAIGGGAKNENEYDTTVERYDSSTDTWCFVKSIPIGSDDPKVAECSNRSLIVACGNTVYQYMQDMDEWFFITKLPDSLNCVDILTINRSFLPEPISKLRTGKTHYFYQNANRN